MTARITLALLAIIPAAMTYPWHTTPQKWILGIAVAVVLLVFAWWRGLFFTTMVSRRFAVWRRNRRGATRPAAGQVTVVLEADELPYDALPLVASYVDRYGVRCDSVRVTERRLDGARSAWVSVTVAAASNLAALQARSSELPLADTAEKVARRLADQLREAGVPVAVTEDAAAPMSADAREKWRSATAGMPGRAGGDNRTVDGARVRPWRNHFRGLRGAHGQRSRSGGGRGSGARVGPAGTAARGDGPGVGRRPRHAAGCADHRIARGAVRTRHRR